MSGILFPCKPSSEYCGADRRANMRSRSKPALRLSRIFRRSVTPFAISILIRADSGTTAAGRPRPSAFYARPTSSSSASTANTARMERCRGLSNISIFRIPAQIRSVRISRCIKLWRRRSRRKPDYSRRSSVTLNGPKTANRARAMSFGTSISRSS